MELLTVSLQRACPALTQWNAQIYFPDSLHTLSLPINYSRSGGPPLTWAGDFMSHTSILFIKNFMRAVPVWLIEMLYMASSRKAYHKKWRLWWCSRCQSPVGNPLEATTNAPQSPCLVWLSVLQRPSTCTETPSEPLDPQKPNLAGQWEPFIRLGRGHDCEQRWLSSSKLDCPVLYVR